MVAVVTVIAVVALLAQGPEVRVLTVLRDMIQMCSGQHHYAASDRMRLVVVGPTEFTAVVSSGQYVPDYGPPVGRIAVLVLWFDGHIYLSLKAMIRSAMTTSAMITRASLRHPCILRSSSSKKSAVVLRL